MIQSIFESVVILHCGIEDDGRPEEVYGFQDCYVQSFDAFSYGHSFLLHLDDTGIRLEWDYRKSPVSKSSKT